MHPNTSVEPTVGRLPFVRVPANGRYLPIPWSRPAAGTTGSGQRPVLRMAGEHECPDTSVEPTVGRLPFVRGPGNGRYLPIPWSRPTAGIYRIRATARTYASRVNADASEHVGRADRWSAAVRTRTGQRPVPTHSVEPASGRHYRIRATAGTYASRVNADAPEYVGRADRWSAAVRSRTGQRPVPTHSVEPTNGRLYRVLWRYAGVAASPLAGRPRARRMMRETALLMSSSMA